MKLENLLGLSKHKIEQMNGDYVISINNVNCTVEVHNLGCGFDSYNNHHALFYFDLVDNNIMNMAIIKLDNLSIINRLRLKLSNIQYRDYVGSVTYTGPKEAIITYLRRNIYEAL